MSEQLITTPGLFGENGNFLLERQLGDGGMGGVYMGRDKMLDRPVAVKVMLKEYGEDAEFVEKAKAALGGEICAFIREGAFFVVSRPMSGGEAREALSATGLEAVFCLPVLD